MRYHYKPVDRCTIIPIPKICWQVKFNHPLYNQCSLAIGDRGCLAIVYQYWDKRRKACYWSFVPPALLLDISMQPGFKDYVEKLAKPAENGLYPTVPVRKVMWALRMKPLKRERWETVLDRLLL